MKSAIEAAGPEVGEIKFFDDIIAPLYVEIDAGNGKERVPFEKKMEILKKYAECRNAGIEYPGDIHFDLYGEPGPDKSNVEEEVPEEVLREVESYHFTWGENDEADKDDIVSPLYKDVY